MAPWHKQRRTAGGFVPHRQWKLLADRQHRIIDLELPTYWNAVHPPQACTPRPGAQRLPPSAVMTFIVMKSPKLAFGPSREHERDRRAAMHRRDPGNDQRRVMNIAIVNCSRSPVPIQSNAQNVPVAAFGNVLSDARRSHFRDEQAFC